MLLNRFGALYYYMGAYARAKPLYQRALVIAEKTYGPEHPEVAWPLGNMAILASATGEYVEAEALYQRSLAIQEKTVGLEHPNTADVLNALGKLYLRTGTYTQAEPVFRRALSIVEKVPSMNPEIRAVSLDNLASMYLEMGSPAQAEPLLAQALAIAEAAFGKEHPETAAIAGSLGVAHLKMSEHDRAAPLLKRALALTEAALGPESHRTAAAIHNLATLYFDTGALPDAMRLYQRAVAIYEKELGSEHPLTAQALRSLAVAHWARDERPRALTLLQRVQRIRTRNAERFLVAGSESRKRDYLRALTEDTFTEVSFAMSTPGAAATELGVTSVLQYKGRVLDAMSGSVARLRRSVAPTDQALLEQLEDVAGQFSALTYRQAGTLSAEQYRRRFAMLVTRQQRLEAELASRSQTFRREVIPVTLAAVRQAIPANAVLVEWFRYTPFNPTLKSPQAPAASRYVAYILKRDRAPSAVDMGPAQPIEALAQRLRLALGNAASTDVKQHAAKLADRLLAPLRSHFKGVEHILFSPDGELNLSACDSGVGEIQNGEGVYGLRRALALAGAQTQLTSLWKIPDDATRELMVNYYRRLLQGEGRSAALRSVQRKMMGEAALSHPYYWASFLAIGNWSSLTSVK